MTTKSTSIQQQLQHKINSKTKPLGALGRLEEIALQVGLIQQTTDPVIVNPHIVVFAGDHGITKTGLVNAYPQEVTAQMVLNFLSGGAAINVFCRQHRIGLKVVDAGVNTEDAFPVHPSFIDAKTGYGTGNYLEGTAMSEDAVSQSIEKGKAIADSIAATGCNCIGFGEMGIGNTSSASLIMSAVTGLPVAECTGRGAGADDIQLQQKITTLQQVHEKHRLPELKNRPVKLLSSVGGFEIAMMTGAYVKAAELNMIIIVDGFIASAALMVAMQLKPDLLRNCIFAHTSQEQGHESMLQFLDAKPLLQLGLRLGEGTGAAMAIPVIQSAVNFLAEMASFESAGVSGADQ